MLCLGCTFDNVNLLCYNTIRKTFYAERESFRANIVPSHFVPNLFGALPLGIMVLLLHDINDAFLDLAKIFAWLGYKTANAFTLVFCVLLWITTRDVLYPMHVVWSAVHDWPTQNFGNGVNY